MPIPTADFIDVMPLLNERTHLFGLGRIEDYKNYVEVIKHLLICASGTYCSWCFIQKVTHCVGSYIDRFFVPPIVKYIDTIGSSASINRRFSYSTIHIPGTDYAFSQLLKDNRGLHADKFIDAIILLNNWTQLAGVNKITALSNPENFFSTDDLFSKKIIMELLTTQRSTRLHTLLHYLNGSVSNFHESHNLAGALSTLIIMTVGFPESIHVDASFKFRFIESVMVDALRASQDSLVFDFVLYYLIEPSTYELILCQENINENVQNTLLVSNKYDSTIINAFLKSSFMNTNTVSEIKINSFKSKLMNPLSFLFKSLNHAEKEEVDVNLFESYSKKIQLEINDIHILIRNSNSYLPPIFDNFNISVDLEKYDLVFIGPDADTIHNVYNAATFTKEIITRRENYNLILSKIEHLLENSKIHLYNKIRTYPACKKQFSLLQQSYKSLITKFKQYQNHVSQYEKMFALFQVIKFVGAFKFEIEATLQNTAKVNRWHNSRNIKHALKSFVNHSTSIVKNMDAIHERFILLDKLYSDSEYTQHIVSLYSDLFQLSQTLCHVLDV